MTVCFTVEMNDICTFWQCCFTESSQLLVELSIVILPICLTMSCRHSEHLGLSNQPITLACYTHIAFLLTKKLSMDEHQSQG